MLLGSTVSFVFNHWGCKSVLCSDNIVTIVCMGAFVGPLSLSKHFGDLLSVAVVSMLALLLCVLLVVLGGPLNSNPGDNDVVRFLRLGVFENVGSVLLCVSCSIYNFEAFEASNERSQNLRSWAKISGGAVLSSAFTCVVTGLGASSPQHSSTPLRHPFATTFRPP